MLANLGNCDGCGLKTAGRAAVSGSGNAESLVMIVGESPGQGDASPFAGPSGVVLDEGLEVAGLSRRAVWLTNVLKCPKGRGKARKAHVEACRANLETELDRVDPVVVVTLGRTATDMMYRLSDSPAVPKFSDVVGKSSLVLVVRGRFRRFFPMYHPAAVLRDRNRREHWLCCFRVLNTSLSKLKNLKTR